MLRPVNSNAKEQGLYIAQPVHYPGRDTECDGGNTVAADPITIFAGLTDGDHLLVWCGPKPQTPQTGFRVMPIVCAEEADAPVSLQVLELDHEDAHRTHHICVRKSHTLAKLRDLVASLLVVEPVAFDLFLVQTNYKPPRVKLLENNVCLNDKPLQNWRIGEPSEIIVEVHNYLPGEEPPKKGTLAHKEMQRRRKTRRVTVTNVTDGAPRDPDPPQTEFTVKRQYTPGGEIARVKPPWAGCGWCGYYSAARCR